MPPVSIATYVPLPTEIPMFARAKTSASFIPSLTSDNFIFGLQSLNHSAFFAGKNLKEYAVNAKLFCYIVGCFLIIVHIHDDL